MGAGCWGPALACAAVLWRFNSPSFRLLEENASDLCCLVSSLVQVMMDPHCRTRAGFQSLVQKEWVAGGHCFLDRCNHLRQSDKEEVRVRPRPLFPVSRADAAGRSAGRLWWPPWCLWRFKH